MKHYGEIFSTWGPTWGFKIYHYDALGNREVIVHKEAKWDTECCARDAMSDWIDSHEDIDVEQMF